MTSYITNKRVDFKTFFIIKISVDCEVITKYLETVLWTHYTQYCLLYTQPAYYRSLQLWNHFYGMKVYFTTIG